MREILFRGKLADGNWSEGNLKVCKNGVYIITPDETIIGEYGRVIPETVGQYTGLTDKNGKKIFEGDIIKSSNGRIEAISIVKYGRFKPKMFYDLLKKYIGLPPKGSLCGLFLESICGEEMLLSDNSHLIEIIGNIHDNPDLLKGETK